MDGRGVGKDESGWGGDWEESRRRPSRAFRGKEIGSPVETDPPALVLMDGKEKAEGVVGRGICGGGGGGGGGSGQRERLAGEKGMDSVEGSTAIGTLPEDRGKETGPGSAVYDEERANEGEEKTGGE